MWITKYFSFPVTSRFKKRWDGWFETPYVADIIEELLSMFSRTIISGNGVASFKLCKENIPMRTSSTELSSKFQKGGEVAESENEGKLVEVGKYIVKRNDLYINSLFVYYV